MVYKMLNLFFMSGTGNSYRAAVWMGEVAKEQGIHSRIIPITKDRSNLDLEDEPGQLFGLVFPTHGFTAPWHMIRFVWGMPRSKRTHAFVIPTRAGIKIGPIPLPGLEGTAGYLIVLLLLLKGYQIRGVQGLDMPSNWMALHWGLSSANVQFIINRAKIKIKAFTETVLDGKRIWGGIFPLLLGLLLVPISFGYFVLGRFFLAKLFFASHRCTGCGLCVRSCPVRAIIMKGRVSVKPFWTFRCESCMRCMAYCPEQAVEVSHLLGIIFYYVTAFPVSIFLADQLANNFLLQYAYIIISLYFVYLIFSNLNRFLLVNKFFTFTTLTHIYRRYHEPETKLKDLL